MEVRINGKPYEAPPGVETLEELAAKMGLKPENSLVKHNREHVPWDRWACTRLAQEDVVEVLVFVGGG